MQNKSGWIFGTIMALIVLVIFFLIGLSVGVGSQGGLTFSDDTLSAWVSALATVCIAILTIFLAKETWSLRNIQLSQIEHIRKDSIKPNIDLYLKSSPAAFSFIDVHIINNGTGSAQNVIFTFENKNTKETEVFEHVVSLFKKLNILKNGISSLGVNEKRSGFVLNFIELNQTHKDIIFDANIIVNIEYEDIEGDKYKSKTTMNFSEFLGITELGGGDPLYKISSILEKIQKDIGHFSSGFKKLKTDVYTNEDRKKEREQWEERRNNMTASKNENS